MSTAFDFPQNPTLGQIHTMPSGDQVQWNGFAWTPIGNVPITYPLAINMGGTSANTAAAARTALGIDTAISDAVSTRVARAGDAMTGVLGVFAGTVAAPGLAFAAEAGLGWFREGVGLMALASGGAKMLGVNLATPASAGLAMWPRADGSSTLALHARAATEAAAKFWAIASTWTSGTDTNVLMVRPNGAVEGGLSISTVMAGATGTTNISVSARGRSSSALNIGSGHPSNQFLGVGFDSTPTTGNGYITSTNGGSLSISAAGGINFSGTVTGITKAMVGLSAVANVPQIQNLTPGNSMQFGWSVGRFVAWVDATNFGDRWPINISGNATNVGSLSGFPDRCGNWGFAGGSSLLPYMALDNVTICYMVRNGNDVAQLTRDGININFSANNGGFIGGIATSPSDERMKENIETLASDTEAFMALSPISFTWRPDFAGSNTGVQDGFSAQNVASVLPRALQGTFDKTDEEGRPMYAGLIDRAILAHTVAQLQKLIARVNALTPENR